MKKIMLMMVALLAISIVSCKKDKDDTKPVTPDTLVGTIWKGKDVIGDPDTDYMNFTFSFKADGKCERRKVRILDGKQTFDETDILTYTYEKPKVTISEEGVFTISEDKMSSESHDLVLTKQK